MVEYRYDAWGNHRVLDANGAEITDMTHIGNTNPFRYRSYYYDVNTGFYYLQSRFYDPETGRFLSADTIDYLEPDTVNGLNLYAYCGNNPIMNVDPTGHKFWGWFASVVAIVVGVALCFVPGAQAAGAALVVGGATSMASNVMSAAGMDSTVSSVVSNVADIVIGTVLCFTPLAGLGAGMIGSGALGLVGGVVSQSLGGSFALGSAIGNIVGGFLGGQVYKGLTTTKLFRAVNSAEANSIAKTRIFSEGAGQMEGKFFATKKAHALQWGEKLSSTRIVGIRIPKSALSHPSVTNFNYRLDGIGPAYYFSDLDFLNSIFRNLRLN